jgi:hypothetical protein
MVLKIIFSNIFLKNFCKSFLLFFTFALMIQKTTQAIANKIQATCDTQNAVSFSVNANSKTIVFLSQYSTMDLSIIYANIRV